MVTVLPFKALKYKSTYHPSEVICPPYDVISDDEQKNLLKRSKYNFVRIELPDSINSAGRTFRLWIKTKVVVKDSQPALYLYQQEFKLPFASSQKKLTRTGFFAAVKLEQKQVIQHEKTTSLNIIQRLELLKELKANASPIFALFSDEDKSVRKAIGKIVKSKKIRKIEFVDSEDIIHRMWIVTDRKLISTITKKLATKKIFIADGHHRYEASLTFSQQYNKNSTISRLNIRTTINYILSYLCPMEDPGIVILPIHRVLRAYPDIEQRIYKHFSLTPWDGKSKLEIVCYYKGEFKVLTPHTSRGFYLKMRKPSMAVFKIPAIILQQFVLGDVPPENIFYTKDMQEAVKKAEELQGFAFLVEPPSLDAILKVSKLGMVLPPKTTYFYPKVPAGLVIYSFYQ
ncbi:MAG: DUF1015 domain-containing protein [Elusimicrobiota bacterium]|nr:DUF1015 domain-containing protein [Elusimicrobiota bacterium]